MGASEGRLEPNAPEDDGDCAGERVFGSVSDDPCVVHEGSQAAPPALALAPLSAGMVRGVKLLDMEVAAARDVRESPSESPFL